MLRHVLVCMSVYVCMQGHVPLGEDVGTEETRIIWKLMREHQKPCIWIMGGVGKGPAVSRGTSLYFQHVWRSGCMWHKESEG